MTVVLLHGYGAPGTDLCPLASVLQPLAGVRFVFLQGPLSLDQPGVQPGARAWWPIDMVRLQVARLTGQSEALSQETPQGLEATRVSLEAALVELMHRYQFGPEQLVVGGFSQGAMLACDWALRCQRPLLGLLQLSGTIICAQEWKDLLPRRASLPTFQSHSPDDEILPLSTAEQLRDLMQSAGLANEFILFRGGHGIPQLVLDKLRAFLQARLESLAD